jgi:putative ABC transport system ATP-binding protein
MFNLLKKPFMWKKAAPTSPVQIDSRSVSVMETDPLANEKVESGNHKPLIEMQNVVKVYKTHAGEFTALKGVTAQFYPGQFVSIIGKSGSGKSTLLNMVTGIDRPTSGKILIDGTYLQDLSESKFSEWRGRNLGIVFQFFQLLPMLSLLENTILPMDFCNMYQPVEREIRAKELLQLVGLQDYSHKPPAAVSSGQEQCAAIARALANDPPILVADEPTGNLDSKTAEMVLQIIDSLVKQGKTILVVTHDEAVAQRASRTLVICDGELVDEDISRAFPTISHRSMLKISHQVLELTKKPGENLFETNIFPGLLLVLDGHLELTTMDGGKPKSFIEGSVLTHSQILDIVNSGNGLRAWHKSPVRIKVISDEDLQPIIESSKSLQIFMAKIDEDRLHQFIKKPKAHKAVNS